MSKDLDYGALANEIKKAHSFIIGSHLNPDGDGIGSILALGMALSRMGKDVLMYSKDGVPFNLAFLPEVEKIRREFPAGHHFDMAIMLDCAQRSRISEEFAALKGAGIFICIDHHLLEKAEADLLLIDKAAASTGEVVMHLLEKAGFEITPEIAQCIYTTLVVDTGFFKYSNTSAHSLEMASRLVKLGADPWASAKNLEESRPIETMRLLALSLSTISVGMKGKYCSMEISQNMLSESGASMEHSEEFATYPRSIAGVEVSALFREVEPKLTKVSLRSKDIVDVAKVARFFGGGGHARAAGARIRLPLGEAKIALEKIVNKELGE